MRMIILASALACLPMAAQAQSDGRDWDRRGDWMQQSGSRGDWRGQSNQGRYDDQDDDEHDQSHDNRSAWRDGGERRGNDMRGQGRADGGRGMMQGGMMHGDMMQGDMGRMHGEMMRRMGGASFMLRAGDVRLAVRCNPSESMKACVDAATSLMDQAKTLTSSGSRSRSSGSSDSTSPSTGGAVGPGSTAPGAAPKTP
ncbi:hypothetical protein GCM10007036_37220 [Alsobacter metallidurans]|uniref:Uncharacterized protein n=1 Tax=Alsobacter metallidurans TaxID=340221 RepID=A0A917IB37_9HYPH|nr:hypothetical protein [Alsobacter metallidurans]GGH28169.1 hypothetical protein GCM10007036_37220 [Alsobacter metallidurans]